MHRPLVRGLSAASLGLLALVGLHLLYLAVGLPGGVVVSDVMYAVVPLFGTWAGFGAVRRATGRARVCWTLLLGTELCWVGGNLLWAWYDATGAEVPVPSAADPFYVAALVLGVAATSTAVLSLVASRSGALRVGLDILIVGGALLYLAWITVLGPALEVHEQAYVKTVTWLLPALAVSASTMALATMTRVPARERLPWLLVGAGFLVGAAVDTVWAYANVHDGWVGGGLLDPLWPLSYGCIGLGALFTRRTSGLDELRLVAARWESLGTYVPTTLALVATGVQHLRGELTEQMLTVGLVLVALLVLRQITFILENDTLARTLESRVAVATAELRAGEEHFRSIVANISDVVLILSNAFVVTYQSPAATKALGYGDGELLGLGIDDLAHPEDLAAARATSAALAGTAGRIETYVARMRHRDGTWRHLEVTVTDLLDHPSVQGVVLAMRDVGDRVELQERLRHQAYHDALTGLANRALLHEELDRLLAAGRRPSLLLLDLDEFKAVNDTAGHDLGDEVLVAVAERLLDSTRPGDLVSRLGGDEFAIVLHDDPRAHAGVAVAERVLHALRMPLVVQGRQVRCLGSIGVAAADGEATAAGLLRDADVAMYVAKGNGKGRIELFTATMREDVVRRQRIEEHLRRAIPERRLVLHYQPVIDLTADAFVGAEALLRLRGDDLGLVSPLEFVPIAEDTGLIVEIGAWVLAEACKEAAGWQALRPDGPPLGVAVNVSTRQLQEPGLVRSVAAALEVADLPPGLLTLEITEGALVAGDPDVDATLRGLRLLGVRLSIDDFGAGYSSLGRLRHLPVDELKIDRSFVAELAAEGAEAPLIDAILALAGRLGLSVVAEGIERNEQAVYLRVGTCERGQGYFFSPPVPAEDLRGLLAGSPAEARARQKLTS